MQADQSNLGNRLAKQVILATCYGGEDGNACLEVPMHEEDCGNDFTDQEELVREEVGWRW